MDQNSISIIPDQRPKDALRLEPQRRSVDELRVQLGLHPFDDFEQVTSVHALDDISKAETKHARARAISDAIAGRRTGRTTQLLLHALEAMDRGEFVLVVGNGRQRSAELRTKLQVFAANAGTDAGLALEDKPLVQYLDVARFYDHEACGG